MSSEFPVIVITSIKIVNTVTATITTPVLLLIVSSVTISVIILVTISLLLLLHYFASAVSILYLLYISS